MLVTIERDRYKSELVDFDVEDEERIAYLNQESKCSSDIFK